MKNRRIGLRVTEDEERKIRAKVPDGMTLTRYMVEAALKRTVQAPDTKLVGALNRIAVNLNEIARRVNSGWVLQPAGIQSELARISEALEILVEA